MIETATKLSDEASITERTSARASESHLSRNTVNLTKKMPGISKQSKQT